MCLCKRASAPARACVCALECACVCVCLRVRVCVMCVCVRTCVRVCTCVRACVRASEHVYACVRAYVPILARFSYTPSFTMSLQHQHLVSYFQHLLLKEQPRCFAPHERRAETNWLMLNENIKRRKTKKRPHQGIWGDQVSMPTKGLLAQISTH